MNITLTLDADQVGQSTITLTAAQLASIAAQESAPQPPQPPTGPVPPYINPQPSLRPAVTPMPWLAGHDIKPGPKLDQTNIWIIPFTVGAFSSGSFSMGEWQAQPTAIGTNGMLPAYTAAGSVIKAST